MHILNNDITIVQKPIDQDGVKEQILKGMHKVIITLASDAISDEHFEVTLKHCFKWVVFFGLRPVLVMAE